jgi:apolipoprotein N-acyltransferase
MSRGRSRGLRPPKNGLERWVVGVLGAMIHGLAFKLVLLDQYFLWVLAPVAGLVGLAAFIWSLRGTSAHKGALLGFVAWAAAAAAGLYWMSVVTPVGYGLLIFYFALLGAVFGMVAIFLRTGSGSRSWVLLVPALWATMEYVRAELLSGFPWMLSGSLVAGIPWATDIADIGGVYMISFAGALLAALLVCRKPNSALLRTALVGLLLGAWLGYGAFKSFFTTPETGRVMRVVAIQAKVPYKVGPKRDPERQLAVQLQLSATVKPGEADLMIWSETMVPGSLLKQVKPVLAPLAIEKKCYLLAGGVIRSADAQSNSTGCSYNSAVLISPGGKVIGRYDKRHLVPFGEFVPMGGRFPFSQRIFKLIGTIFTPGAPCQPLPMVKTTPIGVSICFEDTFPKIARDDARRGARVLVNLTNDSWFEQTSEARQHLALAALRAVETRRPLVRATNTGISALIAADGTITVPSRGELWERGVVRTRLTVAPSSNTPYMLAGDLFVWLCSAASLIGLLAGMIRRKLGPRSHPEETVGTGALPAGPVMEQELLEDPPEVSAEGDQPLPPAGEDPDGAPSAPDMLVLMQDEVEAEAAPPPPVDEPSAPPVPAAPPPPPAEPTGPDPLDLLEEELAAKSAPVAPEPGAAAPSATQELRDLLGDLGGDDSDDDDAALKDFDALTDPDAPQPPPIPDFLDLPEEDAETPPPPQ